MKIIHLVLAAICLIFSLSTEAATAAKPAEWPAYMDFTLAEKDCPASVKNLPTAGKCLSWDATTKAVKVRWPDDEGCAAAAVAKNLPVGTVIDRFGLETGGFFAPKGASFASRAMPYVCRENNYTVYKVIKELPVSECKAAAWFALAGGALQYKTARTAAELVTGGFIAREGAVTKPSLLCQ